MAAPSRPYNTFQVLARHRYRRQNTTEDRESRKGREDASGRKELGQDGRERMGGEVTVPVESRVTITLDSFKPPTISTRTIQSLPLPSIGGSGEPSRQELLSESILQIPLSTSIPSQSQSKAPKIAESLSGFSPTASSPKATVTVEANTIRNGTFTVSTAETSSPVPLASSTPKIDSEVLPGLNEEPKRLGEQPKTSPLAGNGAVAAPLPQAITVNRPMPGKNQPIPIMDEAAASSFMVLNDLPVPTSEATSTAEAIHAVAESTSSTIVSSVEVSTSSIALPSRIISTPTSPIPSSTTFATVTTSDQLTGQGLVTSEITSPAQSATAAQLFSAIASVTISSSTLASSTASPQATSISADAQQQSRLGPLARTLFIIFGVLGAVTILIAFAIIIMMKSSKKRSQTPEEQQPNESPIPDNFFDNASSAQSEYSVTTHISATNSVTNNNNLFLTESEKAIVTRAATPDGEPSANLTNAGSRFTDAINAFIEKSRRLTYKITP
ncbi:hypothetical protein IQ07DRAFT_645300 [Pyrenochaeta sp. DS3sAY3a]|nr:hypothetical protein IQ07DRAFT_645300 [Pyrenochaeta sp. DS3sAY3a]